MKYEMGELLPVKCPWEGEVVAKWREHENDTNSVWEDNKLIEYFCKECAGRPCYLRYADGDVAPSICPWGDTGVISPKWYKTKDGVVTMDKNNNGNKRIIPYGDDLKDPITFGELRKMKMIELHDEFEPGEWKDITDNSVVDISDCIVLKKKDRYIALEPVITEAKSEVGEFDADGFVALEVTMRPVIHIRRIYHDKV